MATNCISIDKASFQSKNDDFCRIFSIIKYAVGTHWKRYHATNEYQKHKVQSTNGCQTLEHRA